MALSLANCITEVRYLLNEATAAFWSDAEITLWLNRAANEIGSKGGLFQADDTIAMVTNQLTYTSSDEAFIANVLKIYSVYSDDGSNTYKGLIKAHPRMIGNNDMLVAGNPRYYCFFNKTFYIMPIPSATWNTKNLMVLYTSRTADVTDLPDEFQWNAITYATAMAKMKDKQFAEAGLLFSDYYNSINFEKDDKVEREPDTLDQYQIPKTRRARSKEEL
jgi:hypothetical protein